MGGIASLMIWTIWMILMIWKIWTIRTVGKVRGFSQSGTTSCKS